ncbi:hypothetical protein YC2023_046425 [Brassica napus]
MMKSMSDNTYQKKIIFYVSAKLCFKPSMKSHNDGSLYNAVAVGGVHQKNEEDK